MLRTGSVRSRPYLDYFKYQNNHREGLPKACFNLSIDFELAWSRARRGASATSRNESLERARLVRSVFPDFLFLCDSYEIPVTFAVVASLLNDQSTVRRAPAYTPTWLDENWYALCSSIASADYIKYYGFDLFKKIKESRTSHEIASHGFSHVDLSDEKVSDKIAQFEIGESANILRGAGQDVSSFVFPNNNVAFLRTIKDNGFEVYRTHRNEALAKDDMGLWKFPVGLWLSPESFNSKEAIDLVDVAIKNKNLINFYCHLYEFKSPKQLKKYLAPIFKYLNENKELIEAATMKEIIKSKSFNEHE